MENASEALMMAFAVLILVLALTVAITSFNQVKAISDVVLYTTDETNYYAYQGAKGKTAENRIVGLETIIPTLYKYYKENYTVVFRKGNYNQETGEFSNVHPLYVYETPSRYKSSNSHKGTYLWGKKVANQDYSTYDLLMYRKYNNNLENEVHASIFSNVYEATSSLRGNNKIFSFDLEEETLRHEPWTRSYDATKSFIDNFLNGTEYKNPNEETQEYKYTSTRGFIANYKDKQFVETVAEYGYASNQSNSMDTNDEEGSSINSLVKEKKKRMIIFTLID